MEASSEGEVSGAHDESAFMVEVYKAERAHELMLNQATSAFEHAAIAPLLLLNGGGAVAFLTLLGAVSDPRARFSASISWAIAASVAWGVGLVLAALAASFGLVSQRAFSKRQRIERQEVERLLLRNPLVAEVVAGSAPKDAKEESRNALRQARTNQRLYELSRWASIGGFVIGVGCAATSVA